MFDCHAAEKLFNKFFMILELKFCRLAEDWDEMTEIKGQMTRMNNFFCGLHYLVGLAECTDETIKLWEANSEPEESVGWLIQFIWYSKTGSYSM